MNPRFERFIQSSRRLAESRGLRWELPLEQDGSVVEGSEWDLSAVVGAPPPRALLSDLGTDPKTIPILNKRLREAGSPEIRREALPSHWQALAKAVAVEMVLVRQNSPVPSLANVRAVRVLATCARDSPPWEATRELIELARDVALEVQPCGQLAQLVVALGRDIIDRNHLADGSPLLPPSMKHASRRAAEKDTPALRRRLADRKNAERLPSARALWEFVRIIFTEQPRTFMDAIRFAQGRILLACAFRLGEVCLIPADWRREREYFDYRGRPAGEICGVSRSLMLRHFAEKQRGEKDDGVALYESVQHVPSIFVDIVESSLDEVARITRPLRERLRAQTESGRIFPEYAADDTIAATEFFCRLFGTLHVRDEELPADLVASYRATWDPAILASLRRMQERSTAPLRTAVKAAWSKLEARAPLPTLRDRSGSPLAFRRNRPWSRAFFRVAECEDWLARWVPTKLPDRYPIRLGDGGTIFPHDLLFLGPKRNLLEERNDELCDTGICCAVGRVETNDLMVHLAEGAKAGLFMRYGRTAEDRALSLNSHALRHLQNTELFRLGLADTLITKRFGRKGVVQSYEYDHRTLAEELDAMDVPKGAEALLSQKALETLRMISSGGLTGPLVDEFKRIQRCEGDDSAFRFLQAEADGFHATAYGFCLTSFLVDPCPKGLECFQGCRHFAVSRTHEHRANLEKVRSRFLAMIAGIEGTPGCGSGRQNQLERAKSGLAGVERALACAPGQHPFPDGADRSEPLREVPYP